MIHNVVEKAKASWSLFQWLTNEQNDLKEKKLKKIIFEIMFRKLTTQDSTDNIKKIAFSQLKNSNDLLPILTWT